MVGPVAEALGATAVYPFQPPWQPFQRWAMRAEDVQSSPLGILIHPDYGLWHAYRAALLFDRPLEFPVRQTRASPCEGLRRKTLPVGLSGWCVFGAGVRPGGLRRPPRQCRQPRLPPGRLPRPRRLSRGRAIPLRRGAAALPHGRLHSRPRCRANRRLEAGRGRHPRRLPRPRRGVSSPASFGGATSGPIAAVTVSSVGRAPA